MAVSVPNFQYNPISYRPVNLDPWASAGAANWYQNARTPYFGAGIAAQGMNTMNNLGSQISNAFGNAAALSSENYRAGMPVEQERVRQQGALERLQAIAPLLGSVFGGGGDSVSPGNISTNYGAGVSFGSGQPATLPNGQPYPNTPGFPVQYTGTRPTDRKLPAPTSRTYQPYPGYRGQ